MSSVLKLEELRKKKENRITTIEYLNRLKKIGLSEKAYNDVMEKINEDINGIDNDILNFKEKL